MSYSLLLQCRWGWNEGIGRRKSPESARSHRISQVHTALCQPGRGKKRNVAKNKSLSPPKVRGQYKPIFHKDTPRLCAWFGAWFYQMLNIQPSRHKAFVSIKTSKFEGGQSSFWHVKTQRLGVIPDLWWKSRLKCSALSHLQDSTQPISVMQHQQHQ